MVIIIIHALTPGFVFYLVKVFECRIDSRIGSVHSGAHALQSWSRQSNSLHTGSTNVAYPMVWRWLYYDLRRTRFCFHSKFWIEKLQPLNVKKRLFFQKRKADILRECVCWLGCDQSGSIECKLEPKACFYSENFVQCLHLIKMIRLECLTR